MIITVLKLLSLATMSLAIDRPGPGLSVNLCDVGEVSQFEKVSCEIELKNLSDRPIHIYDAVANSPLDRVEPVRTTVPAHGVSYLKATINFEDDAGYIHRRFTFRTDDINAPSRSALVQGFVIGFLDQVKPTLEFGEISFDEPFQPKSITLTSREVGDFKIVRIISKPEYMDAQLENDGHTLTAAFNKAVPWGLIQGAIKLEVNAPKHKNVWVRFSGKIIGDVVPDSNPFVLGTMRAGERNEFFIRFSSRSGKDVSLRNIRLDKINGRATVMPCIPDNSDCKLVKLAVLDNQPTGVVAGRLTVNVPRFGRDLPVSLIGMFLSPTMPLIDLNKERQQKIEAEGNAQSNLEEGVSKLDLTKVIKQSITKNGDATRPSPGNGPLLSWSVANEANVYGYLIYRSEIETGPFHRVNNQVIRRIQVENGSDSYQWRDTSANVNVAHWYAIDAILNDGQKRSLGTPQKFLSK